MNHVEPVLHTRLLMKQGHPQYGTINEDIRLPQQRKSKTADLQELRSVESKIKFSPFCITALRREDLEGGEREGVWEQKQHTSFDPNHRVDCDCFPAFLVEAILASSKLNPRSAAARRKPSECNEKSTAEPSNESLAMPAQKTRKPEVCGKKAGDVRNTPLTRSMLHRPPRLTNGALDFVDLTNTDDDPTSSVFTAARRLFQPRPHLTSWISFHQIRQQMRAKT